VGRRPGSERIACCEPRPAVKPSALSRVRFSSPAQMRNPHIKARIAMAGLTIKIRLRVPDEVSIHVQCGE
jgi:hypothetical protein